MLPAEWPAMSPGAMRIPVSVAELSCAAATGPDGSPPLFTDDALALPRSAAAVSGRWLSSTTGPDGSEGHAPARLTNLSGAAFGRHGSRRSRDAVPIVETHCLPQECAVCIGRFPSSQG